MKNVNMNTAISEILKSLEYNTKKEEDFVDNLLNKYKIKRRRSISSISKEITSKIKRKEIVIEDFFSDILNYFRPFSLMIEETYEFLNSYSATIDSKASQFRFSFEKLQDKITFDISNFPKELVRTFSYKEVNRLLSTYEINLCVEGDYNENIYDETAIRFITGYDNDFYNPFLTPASYFWALKRRVDSFLLHEFNPFEKEINNIFEDIEFLLDSLFEELKLTPKQIEMPFLGKLEGNVTELDEGRHQILLKKGFKFNEDNISSDMNEVESNRCSNLEYCLNCLALALQFWKNKYIRNDFDRHDVKKYLNNQELYIDSIKKQITKYRKALNDILIFKGYKSIEVLIEDILKFVKLPYWKHRWHIYELWSLFFCLNIAKSSYKIRLNLKDHGDYIELIIPKAVAKEPVAEIFSNEREIQCWFQRKTINPITGKGLEPDLRFMTRDIYPTDIFVLENKDRRNCSGAHIDTVKNKYLSGTLAKNIWIVNYENYLRKEFSKKIYRETINDRNVWVASNFKPSEIPQEFYLNFIGILKDYFNPLTPKTGLSYDLIIDKSGSMDGKSIFAEVEIIFNNLNYNPDEIYLFDTSLTKLEYNNVGDFIKSHLKCNGGTELVNCFEQYLRSKNEFPQLIYVITDGDGLNECYEKYHLKMLNKGSSLIFVKI